MIQQGSDFGFIGEAYEAPMLLQDAQHCINWYCEVSEDKTGTSKMPIALLGAPGLQQIAVASSGSGTIGPIVNFGTGDGSTKVFNTNDPNLNLEQVYMQDWQGNQLQYTTPRTNLAANNISTAGFNTSVSTLTLGVDAVAGPDNGPSVYGIEGTTSKQWLVETVLTSYQAQVGDYITFLFDMKLTPGYINNENLISIQINNIDVASGGDIFINLATNSVVSSPASITSKFVASLPNGFSRFSFIIGPVTANSGFGISVTCYLNNGNTFTGDGVTKFYIRPDIKKTQTVSSWIKNTTSSAITVTDYSVVGSSDASFSIAPLNGAILTKQTFVPGAVASEVRGQWTLPGGNSALVVIGSTLYLLTIAIAATNANPATYNFTSVGTLLTSTGPVSIADNGPVFGGEGGFAVIVDGTYGYFYQLSGTQNIFTFTGNTTSSSTQIDVSTIPSGLVGSSSVTITGSGIPAGTTITGANFNVPAVNISQAATATASGVTFTVTVPVFGQITDPAFLPATMVTFIEGWLIFSEPNTRTFFTTAATPYTLLFAGSFYALKDSSTDNLVTLFENNRELWLIGERTSEVWYNSGNPNFPFSRIPAIGPQIGCAATYSISRLGPNIVWLAKNEQGQNFVVQQISYDWKRISTHAIDKAISSYAVTDDAIGFSYEEDGHWFYVLTFPTADVTWVYDAKTEMWHQRGSWDSENGVYHRMRANAFCCVSGAHLVGDYQNGALYQMSRKFYSDAGNILRCQRRAPHIWSKQNRKRLFHSWLQVEFTPGVGLNSGQGSDPQAMLRWYDYNKNKNWSSEHWNTIGKTGEVTNRCIWRRLGSSRDRIYELNFSDPVPRDIIGVTLFFEPEEEADVQLSKVY